MVVEQLPFHTSIADLKLVLRNPSELNDVEVISVFLTRETPSYFCHGNTEIKKHLQTSCRNI